jgi:hypothetical protein
LAKISEDNGVEDLCEGVGFDPDVGALVHVVQGANPFWVDVGMDAAAGFAIEGLVEATLLYLALGGLVRGCGMVSNEGKEIKTGDV